jgi:hypothetical protein
MDTVSQIIPTFINLMIILPLFTGLLGGVLCLQIFLSRTASRLPGLLLPACSLALSLVLLFTITAFNNTHTTVSHVYDFEYEMEMRLWEQEQRRNMHEQSQQAYGVETGIIYPQTTTHLVDYGTIRFANSPGGNNAASFGRIIFLFLFTNVPTAIFLFTYFICRIKQKRNKKPMQSAIHRMSVQDLG